MQKLLLIIFFGQKCTFSCHRGGRYLCAIVHTYLFHDSNYTYFLPCLRSLCGFVVSFCMELAIQKKALLSPFIHMTQFSNDIDPVHTGKTNLCSLSSKDICINILRHVFSGLHIFAKLHIMSIICAELKCIVNQ